MKTLDKSKSEIDEFTVAERKAIDERLSEAIMSENRIPVDEKYWDRKRRDALQRAHG